MVRRYKVLGALAALSVVGVAFISLAKPSERDLGLREFSAAQCLAPRATATGRSWDRSLTLPGGKSVSVQADASVGGLVSVRYADGAERHVTPLRDYVYPHDIRVAANSKRLWIATSGLAGGIWAEAHLYEYDLASRVVVRDFDVEPEALPKACAAPAGS